MSTTPTPAETPRTDAQMRYHVIGGEWTVSRDFARTLERELATAQGRIAELEERLSVAHHDIRVAYDKGERVTHGLGVAMMELTTLREKLAESETESAKLRLSKIKTHAWLTKMGVPECADAEGCRAEARAKVLEDRIAEEQAGAASMREAITECQTRFNAYAIHHQAKNTDEGNKRAVANIGFAKMCSKALLSTTGKATLEELERLRSLRHHASLKITNREDGDGMTGDEILAAIDDMQRKARGDFERIEDLRGEALMKKSDLLAESATITELRARVSQLEGALQIIHDTAFYPSHCAVDLIGNPNADSILVERLGKVAFETLQPTAPTDSLKCRKCGKTAHEIGGYLHRVNEKGVDGIWECRPSCSSNLAPDEKLLAALEHDEAAPTEPEKIPVGTRIRFLKTLTAPASSDHPDLLFANRGDTGEVTGHGCPEGYWVKRDGWDEPFGASREEFEPEPEKAGSVAWDDSRLVTVCDKCLQASCWQGIFMCQEAQHAGTVDKTVAELRALGRENPCYWETGTPAEPQPATVPLSPMSIMTDPANPLYAKYQSGDPDTVTLVNDLLMQEHEGKREPTVPLALAEGLAEALTEIEGGCKMPSLIAHRALTAYRANHPKP